MNRSLVNERMRSMDDANRPKLNVVKRTHGESEAHYQLKKRVAESYIRRGFGVVTECIFKKSLTNGEYFKADVAVLDSDPPQIIEVVVTERRDSVARKYSKCPRGWMFLVEEAGK